MVWGGLPRPASFGSGTPARERFAIKKRVRHCFGVLVFYLTGPTSLPFTEVWGKGLWELRQSPGSVPPTQRGRGVSQHLHMPAAGAEGLLSLPGAPRGPAARPRASEHTLPTAPSPTTSPPSSALSSMAQGLHISSQKLPWTPSVLGNPPPPAMCSHRASPLLKFGAPQEGTGTLSLRPARCRVEAGTAAAAPPEQGGKLRTLIHAHRAGRGVLRALAPGSPFRDEDSCLA